MAAATSGGPELQVGPLAVRAALALPLHAPGPALQTLPRAAARRARARASGRERCDVGPRRVPPAPERPSNLPHPLLTAPQGQLLEWLLRPVAAKWSQPAWQATVELQGESVRAWAARWGGVCAEYMAFEVQPGGAVVIESRCGQASSWGGGSHTHTHARTHARTHAHKQLHPSFVSSADPCVPPPLPPQAAALGPALRAAAG